MLHLRQGHQRAAAVVVVVVVTAAAAAVMLRLHPQLGSVPLSAPGDTAAAARLPALSVQTTAQRRRHWLLLLPVAAVACTL